MLRPDNAYCHGFCLRVKERLSKQAQKPRQCPRQERGPALQVKPMLDGPFGPKKKRKY